MAHDPVLTNNIILSCFLRSTCRFKQLPALSTHQINTLKKQPVVKMLGIAAVFFWKSCFQAVALRVTDLRDLVDYSTIMIRRLRASVSSTYGISPDEVITISSLG